MITLLVALLFVVGAIYKWVDAQGRVHYSDTPPPGREDEVVTTSPGPSDEQQAEARQRSQEAGAAGWMTPATLHRSRRWMSTGPAARHWWRG